MIPNMVMESMENSVDCIGLTFDLWFLDTLSGSVFNFVSFLLSTICGITGEAECPLTLLTEKFLLTHWEKRGKEKRENGEEKKENQKRKGGKLKMKGGKLQNDKFLFLFPFTFKTTEICSGSTKMGIFYREKAFQTGKIIRKNDLAPSEKYSSYTSVYHNAVINRACDADEISLASTFVMNQNMVWGIPNLN